MPVHVTHLVRPADGGLRQHVRELAWGMPPDKLHMTVISPEQSPLLQQLPSWVVKKPLQLQDGIRPGNDLRAVFALREYIDKNDLDILHMHGAKSAFIGRMAALLSKRRPRLICTFHNFIEPNNQLLDLAFRRTEKRLSAYTDCYITVSHALARQLERDCSIFPDKIVTIHNGLPLFTKHMTRQNARKFFNIPEDVVVVGTIARLLPEKGMADLIHAMQMVGENGYKARLVIIGDGPQRQELETMAADLADCILFTGTVDQASQLLTGIDIYVQSSWREGFGIAVLEAMWCGVPVIATDTGGLPEIVGSDGQFGLLVPVREPNQLSLQITRLIADEQLRKDLGHAGKQRAQKLFSVEHMIQHTFTLYQNVLNGSVLS